MTKKIGLNIVGRQFDVDVDENFALFLQSHMAKDFNVEGNNDIKVLLQAYIRKTHNLYVQEKKIDELVEKISEKV